MSRTAGRLGVLLAFVLATGAIAPAAGAAPAPSPAPPDGSVGIRLLDAPVERKDDPRARFYIVDHMPPGHTIDRRIEVNNATANPVQVQLYPAAASVDNGAFLFARDREGNDLTDWTKIDPPLVSIPAGGRVQATVHVAVPADAAPGERYGVLWAELPTSAGDGAVKAINRVGVRMYLSVGPGGEPAADFAIKSVRPGRTAEGAPQLVATVDNTGGRALDIIGDLALKGGPASTSAGPFQPAHPTTLATGQSGEVAFVLDPALPAGPWNAEVKLRSGRVEKSSTTGITFPASGDGESILTGTSGALWAAVGGGLLLLGIAVVVLRRRRKPRTTSS